jgi:hypothetical protein
MALLFNPTAKKNQRMDNQPSGCTVRQSRILHEKIDNLSNGSIRHGAALFRPKLSDLPEQIYCCNPD